MIGGGRLAPPSLAPTPIIAETHVIFGYRWGTHGLLHEPMKNKPAAAGGATVETECKFFQVGLECNSISTNRYKAGSCASLRNFQAEMDSRPTGAVASTSQRNTEGVCRKGKPLFMGEAIPAYRD